MAIDCPGLLRARVRLARWLGTALLGSLGALGAGCAAPDVESGICIGDETLKRFEAGKTSESWVRAVLGEPTSVSIPADAPNVRVMRYSTQLPGESGVVATILGRAGERAVGTIYFVVRDGVVEEFWADRMEDPGLFEKQSDSGEKRD